MSRDCVNDRTDSKATTDGTAGRRNRSKRQLLLKTVGACSQSHELTISNLQSSAYKARSSVRAGHCLCPTFEAPKVPTLLNNW